MFSSGAGVIITSFSNLQGLCTDPKHSFSALSLLLWSCLVILSKVPCLPSIRPMRKPPRSVSC